MKKPRFQDIQMSDRIKIETRLAFRLEEHPTNDVLTIYVHDVIGDPLDGMDSASLVPVIDMNHNREILLNIHSPGGSVFDAISIYNALVLHGNVNADITGMAASAATILASAANNIRIGTSSVYWIHTAWTVFVVLGNADEIEAASKDVVSGLRSVNVDIADLLAARSGTNVDEIVELMVGSDGADGTRFNGREAVERGFADELIPLKTKPTPENEPEQDIVKRTILDMVIAHRRRAAA